MSKFSKKFVSGALSVTMGAWLSGALIFIPVAHGQSVTDLQAQISALLAQIQQLQAQLSSQTGGSTVSTFTRDLTVGATGDDVKALQQTLNSKGYQVASSGAGSPGNESTYFGTKTQAALAKFQAAMGISPAVGYFGPKTRAAMGGGTVGTTPPPGVVVPGAGLSVGLAADNPTSGSIISSASSAAARVPVLAVNLTAGNAGGITVNDLKFKKLGVLSDSAVSGAYLIEGGKVIAQYSSLNSGVLTFSGLNLGVNAGQTRKLWLAIDPATNLSAGNTVSFGLMAAADVMAVDSNSTAVTPSGMFPLNGNMFTVTSVSNPSIAALTIASSTVGNSVYAGDQNVLVSQWTLTGSNSAVDLKSINFKVIGSASKNDLKNVKLFVNGTQVGPTLAQVASDGSAFFDLSSSPARINTGSSNMQLFADVTGSPSFSFQFELLNSYDVLAVDTQYNTPVAVTVTGGSGVQITIQQGSLTVTLSSDTPTGNVSKGGSGVALAKFKVYAAGEALKMKFVSFGLTFTGGSGNTLDSYIKNVSMVDDAGNQVGTTINSLTTTVTCTDQAQTKTTSTIAYNCFGSSGSPINYIVPANTTRVLTLRGDIQSTADFTTVVANLVASTNSNLQGLTSSQSANSGSVTGSSRTLVTTLLTVAKNAGVGTQTYAAGVSNAKIGSYSLSASSAEGVNLTTVSILMSGNAASYQNLKLMVGTTQIGTTQAALGASSTYSFSVSGGLNVPAGQSKIVDVYADILSGTTAATHSVLTTLSGCSGSAATTYTAISCSSTPGQNLTVAGQAALAVSESNSSPAGQIVMGSFGNSLATFRFSETSNVEDIKISDLYILDNVESTSTVRSTFGKLSLYDQNGVWLADAGAPSNNGVSTSTTPAGSVGYYYKFSFGSQPIVPKNSGISMILKGDVASFDSSGATDNATHIFKVATTTESGLTTNAQIVLARGATSSNTSTVTFSSPTANAQTVLRSKLTVAATQTKSGGARAAVDDIATLTFTADSAGDVVINSVVLTFGGGAATGTTAAGFLLLNTDNSTFGSATLSATSTSAATFSGVAYTLGAGQSKTVKVRINSNNTQNTSQQTDTLSITVNAVGDVRYTTAPSGGTANIILPATTIPLQVANISYE